MLLTADNIETNKPLSGYSGPTCKCSIHWLADLQAAKEGKEVASDFDQYAFNKLKNDFNAFLGYPPDAFISGWNDRIMGTDRRGDIAQKLNEFAQSKGLEFKGLPR